MVLCQRCGKRLRREIVRGIGRAERLPWGYGQPNYGTVAVHTGASLRGSGCLWFWLAPNRVVVDKTILPDVRAWFAEASHAPT